MTSFMTPIFPVIPLLLLSLSPSLSSPLLLSLLLLLSPSSLSSLPPPNPLFLFPLLSLSLSLPCSALLPLSANQLSLLPLFLSPPPPQQKFTQDPVTTTLGGFSKVTNYLFDAFRGPDTELLHQRPVREVADLLNEVIPGLDINQLEEPGFEVITRGLCHVLRKEGWKFLLGYFPWESTPEERRSLTRRKTDEYFRMKLQWKSVSEEQEKRNSMLRDHRSLIGNHHHHF
uniref:Uncharacterized protein n=1 Tax=Hucho hucho TaxID=62062 RepID=A0A4W5PU12_9TELE